MGGDKSFNSSLAIDFKKFQPKNIAYLALFIAFVAIATFISIKWPAGYFNLGEVAIYLVALLCGPVAGAIAGAIGSALTDTFLGYFIPWAPLTFVIKGLEGYLVGRFAKPLQVKRALFGVGLGGLWMILGYGLATALVYNWAAVLPELVADLGQVLVGAVVAIPLAIKLNRSLRNM